MFFLAGALVWWLWCSLPVVWAGRRGACGFVLRGWIVGWDDGDGGGGGGRMVRVLGGLEGAFVAFLSVGGGLVCEME